MIPLIEKLIKEYEEKKRIKNLKKNLNAIRKMSQERINENQNSKKLVLA